MATGEIVAYLNSDDTYEPNAISRVVEFFQKNPEQRWVCGKCKIVDECGREIRKPITFYKNLLLRNYSYKKLLTENFISQPSTFWKTELLAEIGYFKENEHLCMDYEYWLRIGQKYPAGVIDEYLASFRYYTSSKSGSATIEQLQDQVRLAREYGANYPASLLLNKVNYYKTICVYKLLSRLNHLLELARSS